MEIMDFFLTLAESYKAFLSTIPFWLQNFINLFLLVFVFVVYAVFIWKLYRFIARKDIIPFDLTKFHKEEQHAYNKFISIAGYFIKNIIIFPLLIFFWYAVFTIFLMLLTENLQLSQILIISAIIISAIIF